MILKVEKPLQEKNISRDRSLENKKILTRLEKEKKIMMRKKEMMKSDQFNEHLLKEVCVGCRLLALMTVNNEEW